MELPFVVPEATGPNVCTPDTLPPAIVIVPIVFAIDQTHCTTTDHDPAGNAIETLPDPPLNMAVTGSTDDNGAPENVRLAPEPIVVPLPPAM